MQPTYTLLYHGNFSGTASTLDEVENLVIKAKVLSTSYRVAMDHFADAAESSKTLWKDSVKYAMHKEGVGAVVFKKGLVDVECTRKIYKFVKQSLMHFGEPLKMSSEIQKTLSPIFSPQPEKKRKSSAP